MSMLALGWVLACPSEHVHARQWSSPAKERLVGACLSLKYGRHGSHCIKPYTTCTLPVQLISGGGCEGMAYALSL